MCRLEGNTEYYVELRFLASFGRILKKIGGNQAETSPDLAEP